MRTIEKARCAGDALPRKGEPEERPVYSDAQRFGERYADSGVR